MTYSLNHIQLDINRQGYVSIGNFDGIHRGHQSIVSRLVALSKKDNVSSTVLTFEPHPVSILAPEYAPPRLMTLTKKKELLREFGVDHVVILPVNKELLELTAEEFFKQVIVDQFQAKGLVEGPNFFFGKDRQGTPEILTRLCQENGMSLEIVQPTETDDRMVSSSLIRNLISEGKIETANELLGHEYSIEGTVIKGDQRGKGLGFPTANLDEISVLIPADGVYAAYTELNGKRYTVALNVGPNPAFLDEKKKIEAHLLNFQGDLYHSLIELSIVKQVRSIKSFSSAEKLVEQLKKDMMIIEEVIDRLD